MRTKVVIAVFIITIISICSASIISQSAITSILQDIMSPANTEKAMQLINTAAERANKKIAIPTTAFAGNDCGLPARTRDLPTVFARTDPDDIVLPRVVASKDTVRLAAASEPRAFSSEFVYRLLPKTVRQVGRDFVIFPTNINDMRQLYQTAPVAVPREIGCPCRTSMPSPYLQRSPANACVSNPYLPGSVPNPYLPVTPSLLPPPTQSKGQFLRKIPIPPPMM